jgi:hypothetical protein
LLFIVSLGVLDAVMLPGLDMASASVGRIGLSQTPSLERPLRKDNGTENFFLSQREPLPECPTQFHFTNHYADLGSSANAAMIDQNDLRIAAIHLSNR